jgi:ABC-type dipeptide/oligopeptide/nickel transport system permease component
VLAFLVRRLFPAAVVLAGVAVVDYAMLGDRLGSVFFHLDFGVACSYTGCPPVETLWARSWIDDVSLLVGALAIAIPTGVAAVVMRLVQAEAVDELETDYVRTAEAKGLSRRVVVRRHAVRPAYGSVASVVGVWVPSLITNMVLVEYVFFVPGFLGQLKRALAPGKLADVALVQGLALWGAVLIVAVSVLADVVLVTLDPRVR